MPISLRLLLKGQFQFFSRHLFVVYAVSAPGEGINEIEKEGAIHYPLNLTRTITPLRDLFCLIKLIVLLRRLRPHIVHTHTPKAGLIGMLAAWICRVPVRMHTVAGLPLMEASGIKRAILNMTERITYSCAVRVYPNSKGLAEYIRKEFNTDHSKIKIIGKGSSNGIDVNYFLRTEALELNAKEIRKKWGVLPNELVFGFTGRLVRDKGLVEFIEAFQRLSGLRAKILLVGAFESDLDPLPESVVHFLKTDERVIIAGFQSDVRPWMMAMDVFVFPSYREGFPNAVMQAACLEVPCIVSDINGCNELIIHNKTGWIVPPKNADKLLLAMEESAQDRNKRSSMAIAARQFVIENYSRDFVWHELLMEYRRLLKSEID